MLALISPAKTLDFESSFPKEGCSEPALIEHSKELISELKKLKATDIQSLMKLSEKLSELNYNRFQDWTHPMPQASTKPAVYAFKGDVYVGLDVDSLKQKESLYLQKHLRVLSGLYGLLRPMDLILPYRLEMGTRFVNTRGKNLYEFWAGALTERLIEEMKLIKSNTIVNLASNEYFKAVKQKGLGLKVITPVFKDWSSGKYKVVSFYAKKARGLMCRYMATENITEIEAFKNFNSEGYSFCKESSTETDFVFLRKKT